MKKWIGVFIVGCLLVVPALCQAQVDKMIDRFLQGGERKGEERIGARSLRIVQVEFFPDPIREGQRVAFRVTVLNEARNAGRVNLVIRDRDQLVTEARDVLLQPGENQVDFPQMSYRFDRSDHCFTVEADIEHNRRPIDAAREFCARKTYSGWTLSDKGIGPLYVEDLDMYPDPAVAGQDVRFRVKLRNDGRPIRGSIRIQDKDQVVAQLDNVQITRGYVEFQFPYTRYAFQRFDHCFTVVVDFEKTPYPVDAAKQFCAKPMGWSLKP